MLKCEERDLFLEALVRRKVLLSTLQTSIRQSGASKKGSGMVCSNSAMTLWEKETECACWCEIVAADTSMSPEEKYNTLVAKVRCTECFDGEYITDLEAWSPFFALAASLAMLRYGRFSSEHQTALVELAIAYTAKGAYARAQKLLKTVLRGEKLDDKMASLHRELNLFLLLVEGKHVAHIETITSTRLSPLCFCDPQTRDAVQDMKCRLKECEQCALPIPVMLYCYISVIGAALDLWLRLKEEAQQLLLKKDILLKTSQVTLQKELQTLREEAHRRVEQRCVINLKKETTRQFIDSIINQCEKFLRVNKCVDFAAVWIFAFVKLRWEKEHGGSSSLRFAEQFVACYRDSLFDSSLSTIFLNESKLALKGDKPLGSYTCDLTGVKLPLMQDGFVSDRLFLALSVAEDISLSPRP
ncbi:hypothetical protein TraAM80_08668 [Trypanosoma rangeli]|uniref:Uncharacterized protein n=1 Tax=Trypanosoma rangeli TaxID=5698 RepID=A0A422MZQ1_TRYRA|nr:uncharacterized protein TraAM80_08668 [Trypanosoma rangeli]RNE98702.1 hypothetical protein TraAM80_08668 [Trypanosoma rangeli]|eukprot:RNE98702.1 hypothetical protein TraAM80_08668 [Trypanosoma rangeli]